MVRFKAKHTPGVICIERHMHDEAIVISGSLIADYDSSDISVRVEKELELASGEITAKGGIVGHIKASLTVSATSMISVTEDKAMTKESPRKRAQITLAAIVFNIDPGIAEDIIRKALAAIRLDRAKNNIA
jgi:hypothetical protein